MNRDEFAFVRYLKRCKELHEQWHPGAKYDEEEFKKFASKKWSDASELDKDKFRNPFRQMPEKNIFEEAERKTPFATFSNSKRHELMSENPDMQPIEVMKKIENLWLNMPHTQKKKYNKG